MYKEHWFLHVCSKKKFWHFILVISNDIMNRKYVYHLYQLQTFPIFEKA